MLKFFAVFALIFVLAVPAMAEDDPLFPVVKDRVRSVKTDWYFQSVDDPEKEALFASSVNTYDSDGNIRNAPLGEDGHLNFDHDFDEAGRPVKRTAKDDHKQVLQTWVYTYEDNKKTVVQEFRTPLGDLESKRTYSYRDGKIRSIIHRYEDNPPTTDEEFYTYGDDGSLKKVEYVFANKLYKTVEFQRDEKTGKLVFKKEYRGDGTLKMTSVYNDKEMAKEVWVYSTNGKAAVMWSVMEQKYDDAGRLTEESWKVFSVSGDMVMRGRRTLTYEFWPEK